MHRLALLQRRAQCTVQAIFEVELPLVKNYVGEQIAIKGGVFFEQSFEIKVAFGRNQLIQTDLLRSNGGPLLLKVPVLWIWPNVTDALENH
jgi:hypothetical protein